MLLSVFAGMVDLELGKELSAALLPLEILEEVLHYVFVGILSFNEFRGCNPSPTGANLQSRLT